MATLTAIVTAHADEQNLRRILKDLQEWQVRKADEIIALASDIDLTVLQSEFPKVRFYEETNLGDWGHAKRAKGLDLATSDYAGWFNHDDSYHPDYILDMMRLAESGSDVVYCGWSKNSHPSFSHSSSTSGNFIVKIDKARSAGYVDRHYEADGTFIKKISDKTDKIAFCDRVLYYHNEVR
jgi:hypothetical protein